MRCAYETPMHIHAWERGSSLGNRTRESISIFEMGADRAVQSQREYLRTGKGTLRLSD